MNPKPMIIVQVRIKKNLISNGGHDSSIEENKGLGRAETQKLFFYEITTKPALSDVWTDFSSMVDMFLQSASRIKRIDELVLPMLKLKRPTLM